MHTAKKKRGNLRDKVALYFLLVSITPILAMGFIVVYSVDATTRRTVAELEMQLVRQKSEEIAKFFEETIGVFDLRIPLEIADISVVPEVQRENLLQGTLAASRAIENASFFDLSGKEIGRVEREGGIAPKRELIDGARLEKFIQALSGKPYFSPIHYTLEGVRITVAYPLKNSTDAVVGVLAGDISLKALERTIAYATLGTSGYALLLSDTGNLVASSLKDASTHPSLDAIPIVSQVGSGAAVLLGDGETAAQQYTSFWQEKVFGFGQRVRGLPLIVAVEWPIDDALRLAQEIRMQALIFSLFMLVAVFLISILVARRITQPIHLLQKEAKVIGEGKFDEIIPIRTNDEIEELDDELHEMAKALKTLQQLREEFVFIAAHELRAPVTAIKGYISMILEEEAKIDPDTKSMLQQVQKANQHLVQLVQDLLEVARSEAGRMQVEVSPQNLTALVSLVLSDLKPLWMEKGLAVTYTESAIPQVLADPNKLREVVVNLVSNAIKYNRDRGTLEVWHEVQERMVVTHVRDSGIGLTGEEQVKLFGKFYRAENADTRKVQGTGLGLFIVKQIVEKMGGQIWVTSERGKGSVFSFSLPSMQDTFVG